ncbi:restriction endonuclease subunit S [Lactobacillus sp. ESL0677]|uniref:restriction endonuclease subunit S n=1 Tax=Lactobacillus sp. ESL0677 TaxID=2983208 RepID=UPI0023F89192|nr:restriction endonuclease subunit S [Lactobacillus sp. ESL0677]WEV36378.1 restriction endonuclease subunit S [Lactobacillus sp. ESL0677]
MKISISNSLSYDTSTWEQHKLGELLNYEQPTKYIVKDTKYSTSACVPVLTAGKSFILGYTNEKDNIKIATRKSPIIIFDDFTTSCHLVDFSFKVKSSAIKLLSTRNNKNDIIYSYYLLKKLNYVPEGHERHWISIFSKSKVYTAKISEQKRISQIMKAINSLSTLQERKLELYKQLKKYLLQKMFANEQEKVPKIRFKGFDEDWKKKKLGEIMEVSSVKRVHQSDWTNKGVRFFRARDIVSISKHIEPSEKIYIPFELYNKLSKISGKVKIGDLIVTGVGSIGIPLLIRDTNPIYFKDGNIIWFKNSGKIFGEFFYYSFIGSNIQKYIHISSGSGTVGTYTINSGKITPIGLPKYEEQVKVGSTLKRINENINFNMNKNKLYKQLKQYLLQNLFC